MTQSRSWNSLPWQMAGWYGLLVLALVGAIVAVAPRFSYSLDDPYIHLAVAQNIAQGNYGINAGETVSPSSSVVWPFLLAPLARLPFSLWVPLFYNVVFSLLACATLGSFLDPRLQRAGFRPWERGAFALALVLAANLPGLTLTGMEHPLQVLLVSLCAVAVVQAAEGREIGTPLLVATALAPAVRYEDIVFTGAVCAALWLGYRRGTAAVVFAASLVPLIALGLFLHGHGLAFFPNSVLYKGGVMQMSSHDSVWTPLLKLIALARQNINLTLHSLQRGSMLLYLAALAVVAAFARGRHARSVLLAAAGAASVMLLFGPYGWFFRYDVAVRVFMLVVLLPFVLRLARWGRPLAWAVSLLAAAVFTQAVVRTPYAAVEIARQQYQMHRFAHGFANGNIAVNDVGWVSVNAYGRFYVLDLVGLASNETLRVPVKNAAWLQAITERHNVELVMIYPGWFDAHLPQSWRLQGTLRQSRLRFSGTMGGDSVAFYATSLAAENSLRPQFKRFVATLPAGTWMDLP